MSKKQKNKIGKKNHKILAVVLVAIFLVVAAGTAAALSMSSKDDGENTQQVAQTEEKTDKDVNTSETDAVEPPKKVKQYEGEDANKSSELTGSISTAFLEKGKFTLRLNIDQFVNGGGVCTLTIQQNSITVTRTAPLIADVSSSTCQGFDIESPDIRSGSWKIIIDLQANDGRTGKIEKEVILQ